MLPASPHPFDPMQADPAIVESQDNAVRTTRTFCERGLDAFEFRCSESNRHYVVTRTGEAARCFEFDQLVAFTSSRMIQALNKPWSLPGRA
ncbi:hypothetical protein [Bradyrhizobium ottawaense]|uniref:Uncharacterized protein n=1 Tax=Bradyrhizobium ottawaense TaxID=931866 RepID=A0ABY0QHE3_9BRAD|nr:hypothetical protein [Bradyrhizobium ottawaense]SDK43171.1 hypothetical protein SAMN05444163_8096 [Bradyrhizobium ottawaense]